jgi:DNA-3-methyladenine glycosylase
MQARRGLHDTRLFCAGPGRLCQALGVTGALNGQSLDSAPFSLVPGPKVPVQTATRIGITRAVDKPWRFTLKGSPYLSRRVPRA